jgi:hypothetical protein
MFGSSQSQHRESISAEFEINCAAIFTKKKQKKTKRNACNSLGPRCLKWLS